MTIWLRGGVTYYAGEVDPRLATDNTVTKVSGFSGTLDPQIVISPASHFALTLGLTADIPFSGSYASKKGNTSSSIDVSDLCVGLTAGLLGWF